MKHLLILFVVLFPTVGLGAEGDDERFCSTINLYLENDLFGETDQHYTNGIRFSCVSQDLSSYLKDPDLPDWVREANHRLRFFHSLKDAETLQKTSPRSLKMTGPMPDTFISGSLTISATGNSWTHLNSTSAWWDPHPWQKMHRI